MARAASAVLILAAAAFGVAFADLYLRIDLPGVAWGLSFVFEAVAAVVRWAMVSPVRLGVGALLLVALVAPLLLRGPRVALWAAPGGLLASGLLLAVVVLGGLMERAAFAGLVAAAVVGSRRRGPGSCPPGPARLWLALLCCLGSTAWLVALFEARSSSYGVLRWLGSAGDLRPALAAAVLLLGVGAAWALRGTPRIAALATLVATGASAGVLPWLDPTGRAAPLLAAALAPVAAWAGPGLRGWTRSSPSTWPARLAPFAVLGFALVASSYVLRTFGCPAPAAPGLERVAAAGPVFRVALSPDTALFALRDERRYGVLDRASPGSWRFADPVALPRGDQDPLPGRSHASPEELRFADGRFVGTALGGHPDFYATSASPPNTVNNLVVGLPADGSTVDRAWGIERLCWIGALAPAGGRLLVGCEYEPALHLLQDGAASESLRVAEIGDVAALALHADRAWSVSFWSGSSVARYSLSPLRLERHRRIGGVHYDVAVDPGRDRLFASAYLGSRVRVLRAGDLSDVGTIPTGLGTRALAVDPQRGLVLASSVYDGVITVASSEDGAVLRRLRVGGHVKGIAIDPDLGEAWFASRCGVFRLDLDALSR